MRISMQQLSRFNPEFQRNLWKSFSLHRVIAMPLILVLIFYIFSSTHNPLPDLAQNLMLLLLIVWGTGLSADAIFEEIQDRTWETQRMTPLGAWSMTWGKLFGTTSYVWYGALFAALAYYIGLEKSFSTISDHPWFHPFSSATLNFVYLILTSICAQAFAFFVALLVQRISPLRSRARVTLIQIFTIIVFLTLYYFGRSGLSSIYRDHTWYHLNLSLSVFVLGSQLFFIGWLLIGIYRLLRVELQVKTAPWVWPLFVISWVLYCLGYLYLPITITWMDKEIPFVISQSWYWGFSLWTMLFLSFLAAFFAPKNIIQLYRWKNAWKQRAYCSVFSLTPAWVLSAVLAFLTLIPFLIYTHQASAIEGKISSLQITALATSLFLFLCRDIGILYYLCWNPKAKMPHLATVLYLILLYSFIPIFLSLINLPDYWLPAFTPLAWVAQKNINFLQILTVHLVILLQVGLVMTGVFYRWRENQVKPLIT